MTVMGLLEAIEASSIATAIRGDSGWEWLFPIVETLHVISLAIVYGSIAMVDLRLIGVSSRSSPVSKLSAEVLPYTWVGFGCAVVTGTLMFAGKATTYFYNWAFILKFLCIFLAGANMLVVNLGVMKRVTEWDDQLPPPLAARTAGALSLLLWTAVVFFGRWIGFST